MSLARSRAFYGKVYMSSATGSKALLAGCVLLAGLAHWACRNAQTLVSTDGRFAVDFPGKAEQYRGSIDTLRGQRAFGSFHLSFLNSAVSDVVQRMRGDPLSYKASYTVLNEADQDLDAIVAEAALRAVSEIRIVSKGVSKGRSGEPRIAVEKPIVFGASRGRELIVEEENGAVSRVRVYAVPGRCYELEVFGMRRQVESAAATRFFESFRIIE